MTSLYKRFNGELELMPISYENYIYSRKTFDKIPFDKLVVGLEFEDVLFDSYYGKYIAFDPKKIDIIRVDDLDWLGHKTVEFVTSSNMRHKIAVEGLPATALYLVKKEKIL